MVKKEMRRIRVVVVVVKKAIDTGEVVYSTRQEWH